MVRARNKFRQILQAHQPLPIPTDQAREICKWVDKLGDIHCIYPVLSF